MLVLISRFALSKSPLVLSISLACAVVGYSRPTRIAVIHLRSNQTATRAAAKIALAFHDPNSTIEAREFEVIDPDQARAAAIGSGYRGSFNLELQQARDLGAAVGCDFYFLTDADVVRRSPSVGPVYFDAFATVFLVSSRTGRLLFWERPLVQRDNADAAEKDLLAMLASDQTRERYFAAARRAVADEHAEIVSPVERNVQVIDVLSDESTIENKEVRAPRPFRRPKPPYPESAAKGEVEATIDVLVDLDARGEVSHIEVARWAGFGLDESVTETVRQMHFFPAMRNGVAVPFRALLRYNFRKPPIQTSSHP